MQRQWVRMPLGVIKQEPKKDRHTYTHTCFILASSLRVCSSFLRSFLLPTRMIGTLGQKCFTSGVHFSGMFSTRIKIKKEINNSSHSSINSPYKGIWERPCCFPYDCTDINRGVTDPSLTDGRDCWAEAELSRRCHIVISICVALPILRHWRGKPLRHFHHQLVLVLVFEGQEHQPKINATYSEYTSRELIHNPSRCFNSFSPNSQKSLFGVCYYFMIFNTLRQEAVCSLT